MKLTDAQAAEETDPLVQYLQLHQELLDDRLARKGAQSHGQRGDHMGPEVHLPCVPQTLRGLVYVPNANQLLALRCVKYHDTFDRLFQLRSHSLSRCANCSPGQLRTK